MPPSKQEQEQQQVQAHVDEYIKQLSATEKKVLQIAKEHLETSFSIENSIGFKKWMKNKTST